MNFAKYNLSDIPIPPVDAQAVAAELAAAVFLGAYTQGSYPYRNLCKRQCFAHLRGADLLENTDGVRAPYPPYQL